MAYITRDEAAHLLHTLAGTGVLDDWIADDLDEIAGCIEAEETLGIFQWGADDEVGELHICYRSDLMTEEKKSELRSIYDKYRIREVG